VALRVVDAPGLPGADGVGGFRVDGAVFGAGGVRVDGADCSAAVRGDGADGVGGVRVEGAELSAGVRVDGAEGVADVRVDGADGPGVRVEGAAVGRGAVVSDRAGADGRGALGVAVVVLGAAGAPLRAAGAAGAGREAGASAGASFSRRRRITGASRVDEGDLTNSPMSLAIERTALLSTPSSLASS
jgi:hypothetical protein